MSFPCFPFIDYEIRDGLVNCYIKAFLLSRFIIVIFTKRKAFIILNVKTEPGCVDN